MNRLQPVPICNYKNLMAEVEQLTMALTQAGDDQREALFEKLQVVLNDISNPDFIRQLAVNIILKIATISNFCSPVEITDYLMKLNQEDDPDTVRSLLYEDIHHLLFQVPQSTQRYSAFVEKIMQYVEENLSNPNLTLKWIAENCLYMNVDYVSKRFIKETNQKFSHYLTNVRIQKAIALLSEGHSEQIQWIAEQVGCGNNPQYFSQIFRKNTGMTPSTYAKKVKDPVASYEASSM